MDHENLQLIHRENITRQKLAVDLLLPHVNKREFWAMRNLLGILIQSISSQTPVIPELADYLTKALGAIAEGQKADVAFSYKRARGKDKNCSRLAKQKAFSRAFQVEQRRTETGETVEVAVRKVAEAEGGTATEIDKREYAVEKAWKQNWRKARSELEFYLKYKRVRSVSTK